MCGICGIASFNKSDLNLENKVNLMTKNLNHRGPDFNITFKNSLGHFGFTRLKIIDLSEKSNQPFQDINKKVSIIYNGEIYNYKNLKETFFKNTKFESDGDGEVLIHLYNKFGINFISKIKGMFSICIIDQNLDKIYLIRDRFGIKPLYYFYDKKKNFLYFASEINSIFTNKEILKELNYKEAFKFFKQGLVNGNDETFFKNIFQVDKSSYIEFSKKNLIKKKYYLLEKKIDESKDKENLSFKSYTSELKEKLIKSFEEHNQFDVKCGVHLSGGNDSAILAAMCNYSGKNYSSYTFDFDEKKYSELEDAKKISDSSGLKNQSSKLNSNKVKDYIFKVIDREHEPFSSLRVLSTHFLYDYFNNEAKVILDGNGGDEIGAGYFYQLVPWYLDLLKNFDKKTCDKRLKRNVNSIIDENIKDVLNSNFYFSAKSYYQNPGSVTADGEKYKLSDILENDFSKKTEYLQFFDKPFSSDLRNSQYMDLMHLKLPRTLKYVDRASMYNSTETRVPLLDHEVVESAISIPSKFKILNCQQRIAVKYIFKNYVDKSVLFKNKKSIADPQSDWLKNELSQMILDLINDKNFNHHGIFNTNEVKSFFKKFFDFKGHFNSFLIFQIVIFELWYQRLILNR